MKISGPYTYDPQIHSLEDFACGNASVDDFVFDPFTHKSPKVAERQYVYVAETEGMPMPVAAYISFWHSGADACVDVLAVDIEFQDQGLGAGLLRHALKNLGSHGVKTVHAQCIGSRDFYKKLGFKPVGSRNNMQIPLARLIENLDRRAVRPASFVPPGAPTSGHGLE